MIDSLRDSTPSFRFFSAFHESQVLPFSSKFAFSVFGVSISLPIFPQAFGAAFASDF